MYLLAFKITQSNAVYSSFNNYNYTVLNTCIYIIYSYHKNYVKHGLYTTLYFGPLWT